MSIFIVCCNSRPWGCIEKWFSVVAGTWGEVNDTFSNAYVDGNLVTAAAWPGHPEWMRKFLEVLGSTIEP